MKMIDRIIFGFIAICLGVLAARAIIGNPVQAAKLKQLAERVIVTDVHPVIDVNLVRIGGRPVFLRDFIKR